MKVYLATYCPDIIDSAYGTISVHYSPETAQKVIDEHRAKLKVQFDKDYAIDNAWGMVFAEYEDWKVIEYEILE
jgi:hypothetical protein